MAGTDESKADSLTRADPLTAKLAEIFNARQQLDEAIYSLREWYNRRQPGEDTGLRLLDCLLWASELETKLVQAQIITKSQE